MLKFLGLRKFYRVEEGGGFVILAGGTSVMFGNYVIMSFVLG